MDLICSTVKLTCHFLNGKKQREPHVLTIFRGASSIEEGIAVASK